MRAQHRPQQIVRRPHIRHPVAHRFIDRVLQRLATRIDAYHFRAQQPHTVHVQPLPFHILRAHIHRAPKAQPRRHGRRRYAMLPRARFRDHPLFPHAHGEQALAQAVVDFVRAGVQQVFALQINARGSELLRQPRRELQRRGPPGEIVQQHVQLEPELVVPLRLGVDALQLLERRHQCLWNVPPAVRTVSPALAHRMCRVTHRPAFFLFPFTASSRLRMRRGSFFPGRDSTPLQTSTP